MQHIIPFPTIMHENQINVHSTILYYTINMFNLGQISKKGLFKFQNGKGSRVEQITLFSKMVK